MVHAGIVYKQSSRSGSDYIFKLCNPVSRHVEKCPCKALSAVI